MTTGTPITQQEQRRVQKLREAGLSIRQIAHEQRVSPTTVQKILKINPCQMTQT